MEDPSKNPENKFHDASISTDKNNDFFNQNTRRFVEAKTGEILYIKESGEAYYQRQKDNNNLILVTDFKQLIQLKDSPMSVSSMNLIHNT